MGLVGLTLGYQIQGGLQKTMVRIESIAGMYKISLINICQQFMS